MKINQYVRLFLLIGLLSLSNQVFAQGTQTLDFEPNGEGADWNWTMAEIAPEVNVISNPDANGLNTSDNVVEFKAFSSDNPWALFFSDDIGEFTLDANNSIVKIMVWKSNISNVGIKFEGATPDKSKEIQVANTVTNQWEELTFDFSEVIDSTYKRVVIIPDFVTDARTADNTLYLDNIVIPIGVVAPPGEVPTVGAPTPIHNETDNNVFSIFSDSYTELPETNFNPPWAQATVVTFVEVDGNETIKYSGLDYQGTNLGGADGVDQDVSGYTTLHLDYWSTNGMIVKFSLISRSTGETFYELPLSYREWVSVDIPLSHFADQNISLTDIYQFKVEGEGDVYLDNIYFYVGGSTEVIEPAVAAPTPIHDEADDNVFSIFSDSYTNLANTDFNPYWAQATVVTTIEIQGNQTLKYAGLNYQGTFLGGDEGVDQDVSGNTTFHIDYWAANGTTVKFYLISRNTGEVFYELPLSNREWVSVEIPLSHFTDQGLSLTDIYQFKMDGEGDVYIDNMYFYGKRPTIAMEPKTVAPIPIHDITDDNVFSIYSDSYTNLPGTDFNPDWGQETAVSFALIEPGSNYALKYEGLNYQGTSLGEMGPAGLDQNVSVYASLHLDFWTANSDSLKFFLISRTTGEIFYQLEITQGEWNSVDIPLTHFSDWGLSLTDIFQFKVLGNGDVYFDNIYFYGDVTAQPVEPVVAAPTPIHDETNDNVFSIFSDSYSDLPATDFNPDWGQATEVSFVDIEANQTLKYAGLNYQGTHLGEPGTGGTDQDVSGYATLHLDYWTANADSLKFFLISRNTGEIYYELQTTPEQWNSVDIPLSHFSNWGLSLTDIFQFKVEGNGDIYFDNIYFYGEAPISSENNGSAYFAGGRIRILEDLPINNNANQSSFKTFEQQTIETWVFPTKVPTESGGGDWLHTIVVRPYWLANPYMAYELRIVDHDGNGPKFEYVISNGEVDNWGSAYGGDVVQTGQWYHIAGTYDGNSVKLYVNGLLVAENPYTDGIGLGDTGFYIGGPYNNERFQGIIDELKLWNVAKSASDIVADQSKVLNGDEANLAGYWKLEDYYYADNGARVTPDKSVNANNLVVQGPEFYPFVPLDEVRIAPNLFTEGMLQVSGLVGEQFNYKLSFSGWETPTFSLEYGPAGMQVTPEGEIIWTPNENQGGYHYFDVKVENAYGSDVKLLAVWIDEVSKEQYVHDNGALKFTTSNYGIFGAREPGLGSNLSFQGAESLFEGALLIGGDSSLVGALYQDHFAPISPIVEIESNDRFDIITSTRYTDEKVGSPFGVVITQNTAMSTLPEFSNVALIQFEIRNPNSYPIENLNVGMAMDFDLGADANSDMGGFLDEFNLQYVYDSNTDDNPYFYGLTLLSHQFGGARIWYNGEGESLEEQLFALNSFDNVIEAPGDIRSLVGTQKLNIAPRSSISVVFAVLAAENLEDLAALSIGLDDALNNPGITNVMDVPFDQGGKVQIHWNRSRIDEPGLDHFYSVWRAMGSNAKANNSLTLDKIDAGFKGEAQIVKDEFGTQTAWEWIGNTMAFGFDEYAYTAETLYDSSQHSEGWHEFMIIYHGAQGDFYESQVAAGYSVDNLAPVRPEGLAGRYNPLEEEIVLSWKSNPEADLSKYYIYRNETPDFDLTLLAPIGETSDTLFIDSQAAIGSTYHYVLVAEDIHGNRSEASNSYVHTVSGIASFDSGIPEEFKLYQNFPNPFNPSTQIRYSVPEEGFVTIRVYDILGKVVAELVSENQAPGFYYAGFDASALSTGIYIYELDVRGKFKSQNKMILMK
ncbi:MAG: T9SS type A sorting domain-containing protein [Melioribacteraceae bacterium]|nr:T9SS type A sorting domain-containing protein [Melioribacteraceae bacterium]MCF8263125.1 T9SS type A sorting domain-containing protein [Melioribacteraceae bacterium]MCF8430543.1 T9SS type A sorting domain-containing protein [Melioribacteraceae bacterium]